MLRERVSDNVYWFQSEIYAQVTAGVIAGPQWAVVVDTLSMPEEAKAINSFVTEDLNLPVRYLIDTHSHSDHAWGNCYFPGATIIAHTKCAEFLKTKGMRELEATKAQNPAFEESKIILPHLTFDKGKITLKIGKKNLIILLTPGHSADGISVFVEEDRILFAGDAFMPVPFLMDGNYQDTLNVMNEIKSMGLENIIQGHGDIILRGEIDDSIQENIHYLEALRDAAEKARKKRNPGEYLSTISIEDCGKSRVYLGGLAENLHRQNLAWMYKQIIEEEGLPKDDEYDPEPEEDEFDDLNFDEETPSDNDNDFPKSDDLEDMDDEDMGFDDDDEDEDDDDKDDDDKEDDDSDKY